MHLTDIQKIAEYFKTTIDWEIVNVWAQFLDLRQDWELAKPRPMLA
jgi:hypothetical protein